MRNRADNPTLWDEMEDHFDKLIDARDSIITGDRIVLVGPNGSGKSLLRKILPGAGMTDVKKDFKMVHASMDLRTGSNASMGALSSMMRDTPWLATSHSTIYSIEGLIRNGGQWLADGKNVGFHFDEPEIGFSEELQRGTGAWLRRQLETLKVQPVVTLVTTHSKHVADAFRDWKLIDLGFQYQTVSQWIDRKVEAIDPSSIVERVGILHDVIQTRINDRKK